MRNLKEHIHIEQVDDSRYGGRLIRLNMPVKELFDSLTPRPKLGEFHRIAEANGIIIDAPILASEQDVKDCLELEHKMSDYNEYEHALVNVLINLEYFDEEFVDSQTGKRGLKDSNGKIVVPPLFESCVGARDISMSETLAVVKQNEKFWLTPRDGSGHIINKSGYDKISRSFCYGWVERDGKFGLIDARNGETLIPCEMDWIDSENNAFYYLFGKNGKVGIADTFDNHDVWYLPPVYDEIDMEKRKFCLNGVWGWVTHEGEFLTEEPDSPFDSFFHAKA